MIAIADISLGILLGASLFLLVLSISSYHRSGVLSMLLVSLGLSAHSTLTLFLLLAGHLTDMMADVDGLQIVILDISVLVAALLVGVLGGKAFAGSS